MFGKQMPGLVDDSSKQSYGVPELRHDNNRFSPQNLGASQYSAVPL